MADIIILDDEKHCTDVLATLIAKAVPDYKILGIFNNPVEALAFIKKTPPDLLFLDIEMPFMNGFVLLDRLLPIDFDIIFTTAYDHYAIRAFQYSAINYLQKPITEKNIIKALSSWEKRRNKTNKEQWEILSNLINDSESNQTRMALPTGIGYDIIEINDIVRCQSDNNYTCFHFNDERKVLVSRTLKEVEATLLEHGFFRVHQSHLINPHYVKSISRQDGGILVMPDGAEIPVSRQKRNQINEILRSMLRF